MPIESGPYCQYCADEKGSLMPFDETLERMIQFALRQEGAPATREEARQKTLEFMSTMPAWSDHPKVKSARNA